MSVLVTGAGGLIGRNLVAALARETDVWALTRGAATASAAQPIHADLTKPEFVDGLPPHVDAVVHLAQSVRYREFPEQATDIFNVNVASTARLLDWSRRAGVRRFVLASAGGADRASSETPLSFYLASKRAAELIAQSYGGSFTVSVLRFFFVYGPQQRRSMLIPRLVDAVRAAQPISLAGPDGIRVNPIHVDDAAAAVRQAAIADRAGTFDVAGPDVLTMRQIGEMIGARLGTTPRFTVADRREADLVGDVSAMTARLAPPRRGLASGIEDAL